MGRRRKPENEPQGYFRVKNWDKYQDWHHKGVPPWIKLSTAFFDDAAIEDLPDSQRLAWVAILISAAKLKNRIKFDPVILKNRFLLGTLPNLSLFMAQGLIEKLDVEDGAADKSRGEEKQIVPVAPPPAPLKAKAAKPKPAAPAWSKEACDDWITRFGAGTAPGGPIGRHLKPLVTAYTWPIVRPVWVYFLRHEDSRFSNPATFQSKFGEWRSRYDSARPIKPDAGSLDAALRAAGADGRD